MRYDMKYKKLNVEDNESCNLQCEKKCEKLAGVFICCILAFFLLFLSTRRKYRIGASDHLMRHTDIHRRNVFQVLYLSIFHNSLSR